MATLPKSHSGRPKTTVVAGGSAPRVAHGNAQSLTVEEQLAEVELRHNQLSCTDSSFPDVWLKRDGSVIAVRDMSQGHMCMTIGLWLFNEFRHHENAVLSSTDGMLDGRVSAYASMDEWLTQSRAMRITPALTTMLNRLKLEGGMAELEAILMERSTQSLDEVHKNGDYYLFSKPAFF